MNVDEVQQKLEVKAPNATFKAIIDSSWILDIPYMSACKGILNDEECPVSNLILQTLK
jgi:hypothetical protein